jgi:pyruvate/2-oxoglutarate dehydrogenase complex dihydrolipoamide dehydrogenase (E3) component
MPAKTLLASTELARVDIPAIIDGKRELVDYFAEDRVNDLERLPLVRGRARFVGRDAVEVAGRRIRARRFILATGSRIVAPPIAGLLQTGYLVSDHVLKMKIIPAAVTVFGGGPVSTPRSSTARRPATIPS